MHCPPSKLRLKFHRTTISVISSHTKSLQYLPMAWKNWTRRFWKRPIYHSKIKSYRTCATHKCWKNSNDLMAFGDQKISKILGALLLEISKTKRWVKYSRLRDEGNHIIMEKLRATWFFQRIGFHCIKVSSLSFIIYMIVSWNLQPTSRWIHWVCIHQFDRWLVQHPSSTFEALRCCWRL